ncbi:MAG: electron transfer flavoprotein beta subunit/FixA family protein [Crocinitomicaceae bacterium TMED135]|nr:MAG: electron transfer flavoprotein subunit alpha [Bacteroidetes bacterium MED-G20]RPG78939.1 MAG: electron transfer flavoprotein beta subunit/FixA family protein [Crocinitomicaceae bacterium TMED135]|tara:strand:- start:8216 stop:8956 length:741 start_codon:yes stop_codon:yes gene_type:complete
MKILVCISKVPDTTSKINFVDNNSKFDQNGVQYIVNPYDEWYALVRALELVESNGGTVTTITVGNSSDDPTIRKALAIGANDAVRINANPTDSYFVAKQIADYAANEDYDIIMTGKETIDYNGSQIGSMLSALLEMPFVSLASKLETEGSKAVLERDVQGGLEVVEVDFPFVLSASKGMAEQRIPNMRGIMAARTKPLKVIEPVEQKALTSVVKFELPNPKTGCKYVDPENMEELVELLHNESKVI